MHSEILWGLGFSRVVLSKRYSDQSAGPSAQNTSECYKLMP